MNREAEEVLQSLLLIFYYHIAFGLVFISSDKDIVINEMFSFSHSCDNDLNKKSSLWWLNILKTSEREMVLFPDNF